MKPLLTLCITILLSISSLAPCQAQEMSTLFKQVEALDIVRQGYVLGSQLSGSQKETARLNRVDSSFPGTYKFVDNGLFVVVDKQSHRILIIFEHLETIPRDKVQDLVGTLFLSFQEPTLTAHDKLIYWVFDKKGKVTAESYEAARKNKKALNIIATVKLNSDMTIMDKKKSPSSGNAYYIISSEPLLKLLKEKNA